MLAERGAKTFPLEPQIHGYVLMGLPNTHTTFEDLSRSFNPAIASGKKGSSPRCGSTERVLRTKTKIGSYTSKTDSTPPKKSTRLRQHNFRCGDAWDTAPQRAAGRFVDRSNVCTSSTTEDTRHPAHITKCSNPPWPRSRFFEHSTKKWTPAMYAAPLHAPQDSFPELYNHPLDDTVAVRSSQDASLQLLQGFTVCSIPCPAMASFGRAP